MKNLGVIRILLVIVLAASLPQGVLHAQDSLVSASPQSPARVLFVGNSYTYGAGSPVRFFRPHSVTDLNETGIGGVPALFKMFADEAGIRVAVSLETSPGRNFDYHLSEKAPLIGRAWDHVILQGHSVLDANHPGDPTLLVRSAKALVRLLREKNPDVDIRLVSTWSRADQTYPDAGHWHGKSIEQMALDVRRGCDLAAAECAPAIRSVIPVGEAWNRAMRKAVADPNPYDGISPGQIDLWTYDNYHASAYGYYLSALMIFGDMTGLDPRSLGKDERAAFELGFSVEQAEALEQVAFEELSAAKSRPPLLSFKPKIDGQR